MWQLALKVSISTYVPRPPDALLAPVGDPGAGPAWASRAARRAGTYPLRITVNGIATALRNSG